MFRYRWHWIDCRAGDAELFLRCAILCVFLNHLRNRWHPDICGSIYLLTLSSPWFVVSGHADCAHLLLVCELILPALLLKWFLFSLFASKICVWQRFLSILLWLSCVFCVDLCSLHIRGEVVHVCRNAGRVPVKVARCRPFGGTANLPTTFWAARVQGCPRERPRSVRTKQE